MDDHVYAHVDYLDENDFDRVEFVSNVIDTLALLPILKQVRGDCPASEVPFKYDVQIPRLLEREITLLHVRTMNGQAVNFLYKNK